MNSWLLIVILVVAAVLVLRARGENPSTISQKIHQGARVIDVRTPAEYIAGHYTGATNIPLADLQNRLAEIGDLQKPLVVYCASGMRSAQAAKILTAAGFKDVTNAGSLSKLNP